MSNLLAVIRASGVFIVYFFFAVAGVIFKLSPFLSQRRRNHYIVTFTRRWARISCWLFNIKITVKGDLKALPGSLIVSNHVGTPDIFVLGSCFPGFFVSKAEIADWPLFNWLARLGNTIFAVRSRRQQVGEIITEMLNRLEEKFSVILFPEGQASGDDGVLPFKSSPFEAAVRSGCPVIPATLIYHDGQKPSIACWYNISFFTHIVRLLKNPRLDVTVFILPPIEGGADRRYLARKSWEMIVEKRREESEGK